MTEELNERCQKLYDMFMDVFDELPEETRVVLDGKLEEIGL